MKSFSYLRVSGKGQVSGDGFIRQRETIAQYAKTNNIDIVEEYRDEGVSGTTELADRMGLAKLFDRIDSNGVRLVLVERADRVARDLLVGEVILSQFRDRDVQVIEAASGNELTADDGDPTKVLIRQLLGAVAQFDKSVVVSKLRAARDRHRQEHGRCEGRKPYGALPGEDMVLKQIMAMRRKPRYGRRMSYQKIADGLNVAGIFARHGGEWKAATIRNIVARKR
jgi:DNA invertase Pin-like site-specific DNA recombinase